MSSFMTFLVTHAVASAPFTPSLPLPFRSICCSFCSFLPPWLHGEHASSIVRVPYGLRCEHPFFDDRSPPFAAYVATAAALPRLLFSACACHVRLAGFSFSHQQLCCCVEASPHAVFVTITACCLRHDYIVCWLPQPDNLTFGSCRSQLRH